MNKSRLVDVVAAALNLPRKKVDEAADVVFGSIADAMTNGDRVEIRGFGSFVVRQYGSYTGRNPRTGESIEVRPKRLPYFKVGRELKLLVDGKGSKGPRCMSEDVTEEI